MSSKSFGDLGISISEGKYDATIKQMKDLQSMLDAKEGDFDQGQITFY